MKQALFLLLLFFSCKKQEEVKPIKTSLYIVKIDWDLDAYVNIEGKPAYPIIDQVRLTDAQAISDTSVICLKYTKQTIPMLAAI